MRYLSLYLKNQTNPIVCVDLFNPKRSDLIDGIYYADKFGLDGFESNYKNIFKAMPHRTCTTSDELTSERIAWWDIPRRLNNQELIAFLEALLSRGKDKKTRKMHPNSLANLMPAKQFNTDNRPTKPRKLSEQQLDKALELRSNGCSWRRVGDLLDCNYQTVRSSLRRRGLENPSVG